MSDVGGELHLAEEGAGRVDTLLRVPSGAHALLVFAHGAGAGMRHPFMSSMAEALAERGVATLRYQFPYTQAGKKRPDPPRVLLGTVRAAVAEGVRRSDGLALFAGGKSMGGRMTSQADAGSPLPGVRGLIFLGFPLHAPKQRSETRGEHLAKVERPMLFIQGTRDDLADFPSIGRVVTSLGSRATMHVVEEGNHSFAVPKRAGRSSDEVLASIAEAIAGWTRAVSPR